MLKFLYFFSVYWIRLAFFLVIFLLIVMENAYFFFFRRGNKNTIFKWENVRKLVIFSDDNNKVNYVNWFNIDQGDSIDLCFIGFAWIGFYGTFYEGDFPGIFWINIFDELLQLNSPSLLGFHDLRVLVEKSFFKQSVTAIFSMIFDRSVLNILN